MRKRINFKLIFLILTIMISALGILICNSTNSSLITQVYYYPSPFEITDGTTSLTSLYLVTDISTALTQHLDIGITIRNQAGEKIWTKTTTYPDDFGTTISPPNQYTIQIAWSGVNDIGQTITPGIYIADILIESIPGGEIDRARLRITVY